MESDKVNMAWRVYVDGGCTKNNIKDASNRKAGCGVYVCGNPVAASISPTQTDVNKPLQGNNNRCISETLPVSAEYPATNNRAELLGIVRALEALFANQFPINPGDHVTFINDSKLVYSSITDWIPRIWRHNNYRGGTISNLDLVKRLDALLKRLDKADYVVEWKHVNSHKKEPPVKTSMAWRDWHGNDQADRLANLACGRNVYTSVRKGAVVKKDTGTVVVGTKRRKESDKE